VLALSASEVEGPRLSGTGLSVREVSGSIVIAWAKAQDERGRFRLEVNMTNRLSLLMVFLVLATVCLAQEGLTVQNKGKRKWPAAEAQKIYVSACSAVQREFGSNRPVGPRVTVVLGAGKNDVWFQEQEIRLTKWVIFSPREL
jgi:hypothetical protein